MSTEYQLNKFCTVLEDLAGEENIERAIEYDFDEHTDELNFCIFALLEMAND